MATVVQIYEYTEKPLKRVNCVVCELYFNDMGFKKLLQDVIRLRNREDCRVGLTQLLSVKHGKMSESVIYHYEANYLKTHRLQAT